MKFISPFVLLFLFSGNALYAQDSLITYSESDALIINPSRGFYQYTQTNSSSPSSLDSTELANIRTTEHTSVIFRYVYLDEFYSSPISASFLEEIASDFDAIRSAGFKVVLRFAYTSELPDEPPYNDSPEKERILEHIGQLRPLLEANADLILTLQNGFWGIWGENYYSDAFGTDDGVTPVTEEQWADRKEVTDSLLAIMPESAIISLRYPDLKAMYYDLDLPEDSLTLESAHSGTDLSRLGYHNDCFLVAANDFTFGDTETEKPFWERESKYTAMGGESCGDNPTYTNCSNALVDLENAHWTYINNYYHPDVIDRWEDEGCYAEIDRRLGYRFVLDSGRFDTLSLSGGPFDFQLYLRNIGFAATVEPKEVRIVLTTEDTAIFLPVDQDTRFWFPGNPLVVDEVLIIPADLPVDMYELHLFITDSSLDLQSNPLYAIQVANEGLWDETTGYNHLMVNLRISDNIGVLPLTTTELLTIYPNPSQEGLFYLEGMTSIEAESVRVYNLTGALVHEANVSVTQNALDLSHLENGTYIIQVNHTNYRIVIG